MHNLSTLQISSTHPCLIVYLLDQSGSMAEFFGNSQQSKAEKLAESINEIIFETGLKCVGAGGDIRNRFEIAVVGYGVDSGVSSAWQGNLAGRWVVSIDEVFQNPIGEENGTPIWIAPIAQGQTPMNTAFENAYRICEAWINWGNHIDCYPPIVINITDGAPTDSEVKLRQTVHNLKNLRTNYGGVNIFNIHISSGGGRDGILFPSELHNATQNANLLFDLSTPLNDSMIEHAKEVGYEVMKGAKGYVYNGTAKHLVDFLNIGSNPL